MCLLAVCPSVASATTWVQSGESVTYSKWFVDLESIKDVPDGYGTTVRKAWIKIDHTADKTVTYRERKSLFFFKCSEEQSKTVSTTTYNADGTVAGSYSPSYAAYSPVVPDSVLASAMKIVCAA
jgi:hypothetical protein